MKELVKELIMELCIKQPIFWIIIIWGFLGAIFYKKIRGFMGEFGVKTELKKLPKDKYIVLNDFMIKSNKGTHQIDHIVISKFGIFVIEMKNYYGVITGNEYKDKWTQHLGRNKYYFNNPILQTYGHIKALEEVLQLDKKNFISIVCFSNQAILNINAKNITQLENINTFIKSYTKEVVTNNLRDIEHKLKLNNILDKEIRKNHIQNIKNTVKQNNEKEKNMICPKCGGNLVERNGKYGEFIGCQNYPKCKYTKNIKK